MSQQLADNQTKMTEDQVKRLVKTLANAFGLGFWSPMTKVPPKQCAPANRPPRGSRTVQENFNATLNSRRALPAAVAELGREEISWLSA
jgi:hypothetical protein